MEPQGLAQQSQGQQQEQMVMQVVQALMQGMSPEDLAAQGVPNEVIQMAMQIVQQEMAKQQQAQPEVGPSGLAGSQMAQGRM